MKKFIKKTLAFALLPLSLGGSIILVFFLFINNQSATCKIEPNISTLFIGDSHIQKAIDDRLIPNSLNVATSSESFYFTYYKLIMLLDNNPTIEKVFVGFSYHSISNYYDRFVSGDYSAAIAPKYFYLLPHKEQIKLIYWNKDNLVPFIKSTFKHGFGDDNSTNCGPYLGGFLNEYKKSNPIESSMDKRLITQYYNQGEMNSFSDLNILYLKKIINLCKAKGIEVYTLNTPLYNYYSNKVPNEYRVKFNYIISSNQLNHIDLSNLKLIEECFIPDGDHVSNIGARAVSIELNNNAINSKESNP